MDGTWRVAVCRSDRRRSGRKVLHVVYEDDDRRAVVLAIDPTKTMAGTGNTKLAELAEAVKEKLSRALARLE